MAYEITPEMEAQRRNKDEEVTEIYFSDLDMLSIDAVIDTFKRIKDEFGSRGPLRLDHEYPEARSFRVLLNRPETDEELRTRVNATGEAARVREIMEREQLKRLINRYGIPKD